MPTISEIEKEIGWTEEEASMCGCYIRPEPCENCWSLGWRLGADDVIDDKDHGAKEVDVGTPHKRQGVLE